MKPDDRARRSTLQRIAAGAWLGGSGLTPLAALATMSRPRRPVAQLVPFEGHSIVAPIAAFVSQ